MWIYKYQEKFYFCRNLLKEKKSLKKIPQSNAPLTEDSPCARRMGRLPPTLEETRVWSCPFLWAFSLLVPPGACGISKQAPLCRAPSVHASVCTCMCVCVYEPTFP